MACVKTTSLFKPKSADTKRERLVKQAEELSTAKKSRHEKEDDHEPDLEVSVSNFHMI